MTAVTLTRPLRIGRLSTNAALYLQASIVVALVAGSSAPTPLYAVYQGEWGFSPITTTLIFGVYAVAVLAALLTVGSLSDHIGRRPVLLAALAVQAPLMLVFATASGVPELMVRGSSRGCRLARQSVPSVRACSTSTGSRAPRSTRSPR